MAGLVTQVTDKNVDEFIDSIEKPSKREDSKVLKKLMEEATGEPAKIWGDNFIIGFGNYRYRRKGKKEEYEWFNMGFAPRKTRLTLYLTMDISKEEELLSKLGKCKWGKGCLHINKLADVDLKVLKTLINKRKTGQWHSSS